MGEIHSSYHKPGQFGEHMHCGSGNIKVSVCHLILQDHAIKGSCDFMDRSLLR